MSHPRRQSQTENPDGSRQILCEMLCAICNYHWMAWYTGAAEKVECPECGFLNDRHDKWAKKEWE